MQERRDAEPVPPRPIDEGRVAQAIVEYTGMRLGTFRIRGPSSGREYSFDASPLGKRRHVLVEDLDRFSRHTEFRILREGRIEPEAEEAQRRETQIAQLRAEIEALRSDVPAAVIGIVKEHMPKKPRHPTGKLGGRPRGRGLGALLDCWMTCGSVGDLYGSAREAYDAIQHYLREHPFPGMQGAPRERLPSMRSDARRKRDRAGGKCLWHRHPEPVPDALLKKATK